MHVDRATSQHDAFHSHPPFLYSTPRDVRAGSVARIFSRLGVTKRAENVEREIPWGVGVEVLGCWREVGKKLEGKRFRVLASG